VSDSVRPHRRQPTRLPRPWDSPGKNTGVGCHFLLQRMKVKSKSEVAQLCPTVVTPWTAAYQAPPSMGFSRQKYWSGVPLPSPMENSMEVPEKTTKKKRKIELPCDPAIPLLGVLSGQNYNSKRYMHPMLILVLFIITKTWKQLKCPLTDEWLKMWYIYIMEYYSVIKKKICL